jgi:plastocyanin
MSTRNSGTRYMVIGAVTILFAVLLAGCTGTNYGPAPVTTPATPAATAPPATPAQTIVVTTTTMAPATPVTSPPATTAAPTTSSPPPGVAVTIQNFAFTPASVTVPKGTTVTWTNKDPAPHTVVNDAASTLGLGKLFSSPTLGEGQQFSFTFNDAGIFSYHCGIHTFMKGTITVT